MDLSEIGRQFGLNEAQTRAAFEALAPVVAAGVRREAGNDGGLGDLLGAVLNGNHGRYVDDPSVLGAPETAADGNAILGHIFGSKEVSRGVAQQLSADTGIGAAVLKKLLPVIAAMVMGQIAKKTMGGQSTGGGGLGDILGGILGGGSGQPQSGGGGLGDILGSILGGAAGGQPSGGGGLGDILGDLLGGGADAPQRQEQISRGRKTLDGILGGGTTRGNAADDLLASVDRLTRR